MLSTPPLSFSDSGAHGKVTVEATVDKSGSVIATKVVQNTTGSEALGKFILLHKIVKNAGGRLVLCSLDPEIFLVFETNLVVPCLYV